MSNLDGGFSAYTAFDVSGDGSVVVGQGFDAMGAERGFRWSTDGSLVVFDALEARGVSGDGQVVVGRASLGVGADGAARWTSAGGVTSIRSLPGDLDIGYGRSASFDGSAVVGEGHAASGVRKPYHWTAATGMTLLGTLPSKPEGYGLGVSGDGLVAVGHMYTGGVANDEAFRWTAAGGMVRLGYLPNHTGRSYASAASYDGSIVVGSSGSGSGREAFRWTDAGGMESLGDLPGGDLDSAAFDVSGDGSIVVGIAASDDFRGAVFWNEQGEIVKLKDFLVASGVDGLDDWTLWLPWAVSHDGRTIVGEGFNPQGEREAWIATIPEPSAAALAMMGLGFAAGAARSRRSRRQSPSLATCKVNSSYPLAVNRAVEHVFDRASQAMYRQSLLANPRSHTTSVQNREPSGQWPKIVVEFEPALRIKRVVGQVQRCESQNNCLALVTRL
jgi:probable HAF family extracellular repeat protein